MATISEYLELKRKNAATNKDVKLAKRRLYDGLRAKRTNASVEGSDSVDGGGEPAPSRDVPVDTKSPAKKRKPRAKGKRLPGGAAKDSRAIAKSGVLDSVHGSNGSVSEGVSEQQARGKGSQGDLLSKEPSPTSIAVEA